MDALTENVRSFRAEPVSFEIDGELIEIEPPTLAQAKACVRLDPPPGKKETAAEQVIRAERQARILLGPQHAHLIDKLQSRQIAVIVHSLYIAASGMSAQAYAQWVQARQKAGDVTTAAEIIDIIDRLVIDLAARQGTTLSEAEKTPMADAISLRERIAELEKAKAELQATIAGVKLTWG